MKINLKRLLRNTTKKQKLIILDDIKTRKKDYINLRTKRKNTRSL